MGTAEYPSQPQNSVNESQRPQSPFLRREKPCLHVLRSAIMSFLIVLYVLNLSTIDESDLFEVDFAQWEV